MATLRQHIYNVRNLAGGGRTTRSHPFSDRQIAFWVRYWRNFLLKNNIQKYEYVPQGYVQDLGCLELTKADVALCTQMCFGENTYYVEIPEILDLPDNMGLTFFGLIDKQTRIRLSDYNYGSYHRHARFVPQKALWAEKIDNMIYVHSVDDEFPIKWVNVQCILADPAKVVTCSAPGEPLICFDWDEDCYPMPPGLESAMYDLILEREFGIARGAKQMGLPDQVDDDKTDAPL